MPAAPRRRRAPHVEIDLAIDELRCLVVLSDFHQRSMGFMRHVVRLTTAAEMRTRMRFIDEESKVLRAFAQSLLEDAQSDPDGTTRANMTPAALTAFWGRLLSSLNSPRSRRRLSAKEIEFREVLAARLEDAFRRLQRAHPDLAASELATRRSAEQGWIRRQLESEP